MKKENDFVILTVNEPTKNNTVYNMESVEQLVSQFNERTDPCYVFNKFGEYVDVNDMSGTVTKLELQDNQLVGTMTLLDTTAGMMMSMTPKEAVNLTIHSNDVVKKDDDSGETAVDPSSISLECFTLVTADPSKPKQ